MNLFLAEYTKINNTKKSHFLFDSRQDLTQIKNKINSYTIIKNNEFFRLKFYLKNKNKIKSCFCFGNVPPPIKLNVKTLVYFQNLNILNSSLFKEKFKKKYILFLTKSKYIYVFQTTHSCNSFKKIIKKKIRAEIMPFFYERKTIEEKQRLDQTYFYPASNTKNKNHKFLISCFKLFAKNTKTPIVLYLTISNKEYSEFQKGDPIASPSNLKIVNLGSIHFNQVLKIYKEVQYLIFPSIEESFGLPLIEATQYGCKVISSDLPFTHQVIKPSLTFNPLVKMSLINKLIQSIKYTEIKKTTLTVENKLSKLIELIYKE